ncbi:MAG: hypothetical protein AB7I33_04375 [Gemmatimonadales bacterium]
MSHPPWHRLLGPAPNGSVPERSAVAPAAVLARPEGSAIAGWEQLVLDQSAGHAGRRTITVLLDADGRAIGASDMVMFRVPPLPPNPGPDAPPVRLRFESISGRFESDGTFRGTCWVSEADEPVAAEDARWEMSSSEPTPASIGGLRSLVTELMKRAEAASDP